MPMQARRVELIVARDLRRRLAGGKAAVDLGALQMLARLATSTHATIRHDRRYKNINFTQSFHRDDCYRKIPLFRPSFRYLLKRPA